MRAIPTIQLKCYRGIAAKAASPCILVRAGLNAPLEMVLSAHRNTAAFRYELQERVICVLRSCIWEKFLLDEICMARWHEPISVRHEENGT
ncbi:hypothetical protein GN244_ATG17088 [Phytophthora infestans]|uniref:Uncharacterized protein n=1 Tax=Phytophthora infestans TaxID=4787 RepID=A0A833WLG7_PHYIN|nr:hypothetical protein GN244_ATG17088 [Phytophthora infestans]